MSSVDVCDQFMARGNVDGNDIGNDIGDDIGDDIGNDVGNVDRSTTTTGAL